LEEIPMKSLVLASFSLAILAGCASSNGGSGAAAPEKGMVAKDAQGGYYAEEPYKGRLFVLGTEKAHKALRESQQAPHITKTYIGAGPDGQTLVLEADAKSNELQERLKVQYESRHGVKLP
jgi:hypothetical protein